MSPIDPHSYARPGESRVTHVALDLAVDFERRELRGSATLHVTTLPSQRRLILDARGLAIEAVTDEAGAPLAWSLAEPDAVLGAALTVEVEPGDRRVVVAYTTAPGAEALQWLEPAQTAGGALPFLFTQGHAIHSRSWIPLQDSPALRVTYEARITAPLPMVAVMSAERLERDADGAFRFRMTEPIPAYLIALAVGDLATREVGPRTAVFAEPTLVERAAHELAEMERMLEAAEALVGPYRWGRFDVLIMPPSFPYGGMENPRLTFASPTLLVGDRSLTTVIVHELAHAWAGNLVTNATWADFWINEGTTVYLELRLNEALWGEARASMLMASGFRDLALEIARMGPSSPDTRLRYDMTGRDPSEGVTVIPYLKGAAFFWTLERVVGRARLDAWLRGWFERRAFHSVTTDQLLADLRAHLLAGDAGVGMDLERWVDAPGVPPDGAPPASALLTRVDADAAAILAGAPPASIDVSAWTPHAWRHFLVTMLAGPVESRVVLALDEAFDLSRSTNAEILAPWLRLEVKAGHVGAAGRIERFLGENGRMKYLRPLYADLLTSPWGRPIAERAYLASRDRYHALVRTGLERLIAATSATAPAPAPRFANRANEPHTLPDGRVFYASRSVAVTAMVIGYDDATRSFHALVSERGPAVDHAGAWCLVCGYLDWDESLDDAVRREVHEEAGVDLRALEACGRAVVPAQPYFVQAAPTAHRQNVTARFAVEISGLPTPSAAHAEPGEVTDVRWVPLVADQIASRTWAFGHDAMLLDLIHALDLDRAHGQLDASSFRRFIRRELEGRWPFGR